MNICTTLLYALHSLDWRVFIHYLSCERLTYVCFKPNESEMPVQLVYKLISYVGGTYSRSWKD